MQVDLREIINNICNFIQFYICMQATYDCDSILRSFGNNSYVKLFQLKNLKLKKPFRRTSGLSL